MFQAKEWDIGVERFVSKNTAKVVIEYFTILLSITNRITTSIKDILNWNISV